MASGVLFLGGYRLVKRVNDVKVTIKNVKKKPRKKVIEVGIL